MTKAAARKTTSRPRPLVTAVIGVAALVIVAVGIVSFLNVRELQLQIDTTEREIGLIRAEIERQSAAIERLRTDPDHIEQVARETLGLVRPGERVLKLPPSPGS